MQTLDILHPSTSLEWEEWPSLPVGMQDSCSVYLNGTLYVGGGFTDEPGWEAEASLYSFKPGVDSTWTVTDTPTSYYTLVVHDSELLLVGGSEYLNCQHYNVRAVSWAMNVIATQSVVWKWRGSLMIFTDWEKS